MDAQPGGHLLDSLVQRLGVVAEEAHLAVARPWRGPCSDDRLARLQHLAAAAQRLGREQHLVFAGGIGQGDEGELARRWLARPRSWRRRTTPAMRKASAPAAACGERVDVEGRALAAQDLDHVLQRVAGQIEADRRQFLVQLLGPDPAARRVGRRGRAASACSPNRLAWAEARSAATLWA